LTAGYPASPNDPSQTEFFVPIIQGWTVQAPLQRTGIEFLGDMAWGTHLCVFFETKEDLLETVVPYFRAGLEDNEFCFWAVSEPVTVPDAKAALREGIPDFDEHLSAGSIEIIPGSEWYLKGGHLDLKRVTSAWGKKTEDAISGGYRGMRASGNAFWIDAKYSKDWKTFTEYEHEVDQALAGQLLSILCTYAIPESQVVDLLDVVRAHQFTVARRRGKWEILESPSADQTKAALVSAQGAAVTLARLSAREREVLSQLSRGAKNKEIAAHLGISMRTVESYRSRILLKTNARNLPELVRLAIEGGVTGRGYVAR
jgi:DNA-binding CsgD family transcriptional regulator